MSPHPALPEYPGPEGTPFEHSIERYFITGNFIVGFGYGIQVLLYFACIQYLWQKRKTAKNWQPTILIAYMTLLLAVETMFVGVQANTVIVMYVDNRNYPGGPWQWFLATQYLAINVIFFATLFVLTFLCDLIVLWRCWVIWTASGKWVAYIVVAFPTMALLTSFALGTIWTLQSTMPGLSMYAPNPLAWGTSYYAVSLGINILLTILIIVRLLMYRRTVMATLPAEHAKHYVSLATVIVESAALYSVAAVLFLITYAVNNPSNQVFLGIASAAQQIAAYLIVFRLASGRAWTKDTLNRNTHHQGQTNNGLATMDFATPTRGADTTIMTQVISMAEPPFARQSLSDDSTSVEERKAPALVTAV